MSLIARAAALVRRASRTFARVAATARLERRVRLLNPVWCRLANPRRTFMRPVVSDTVVMTRSVRRRRASCARKSRAIARVSSLTVRDFRNFRVVVASSRASARFDGTFIKLIVQPRAITVIATRLESRSVAESPIVRSLLFASPAV